MLKKFFSFIIFTLLLIQTLNQTTGTAQQVPLNNVEPQFQKFNDMMLRNLEQEKENVTEVAKEMETKLQSQIFIWTSIGLGFVLYFIVMALIEMTNPKSSILYAKYDTTRAEHEL